MKRFGDGTTLATKATDTFDATQPAPGPVSSHLPSELPMNMARPGPSDLMPLWTAAVMSRDPDAVTSLYDPDVGVLWGTLSTVIRDTPERIREYFVLFLARRDLRAQVHDSTLRIVGDVLVDSGSYTFTWTEDDGTPGALAARYSFVWADRGRGWQIVDHHSSAVPT